MAASRINSSDEDSNSLDDNSAENSRIIVHCDLDAFFAAVETLHHDLDPSIPLIIGSEPNQGRARGIVSTCNYPARKYGIHSAMPIGEAWRRCPGKPYGNAIYISGTRGLYSRASRKVMEILKPIAGKFEKASIDEAYLDITDSVDGDWDSAFALCRKLQQAITNKVGLTASFGIGPTRILAKMSSEINKPNGIFRILPDEIQDFFIDRPVREVPGVGPKTATMLAEWGIGNVDEAYELGELALARMTNERFASRIIRLVDGTTTNEVSPLRSRKSVGKEHTFDIDQFDSEVVLARLNQLVLTVMERAQEMGVSGRLAEVKIRYSGFETHTHGRSIPVAMDDTEVFSRLAQRLFANNLQHGEKVRLIGFRLGHLEMPLSRQITLNL
ncbi:MAG: DNA polymerase IV [Candidatus Poseidoniaceae archaeon]|jgi:DNA polymerase IV (DinB-like DNA polymerase)|nr:DNA polymerase IV [Candidatus Poseidoniaceae archaeon]